MHTERGPTSRGRRAIVAIAAVLVASLGAGAPARADILPPNPNKMAVLGWGSNFLGALGDGTGVDPVLPVRTLGIVGGVKQVATGGFHSVAVTWDGTVWTWGSNTFGELGDGTTIDRLSAVQVPGLTGVTQVAAGYFHTLALKSDGTVWAWGYGEHGAIGDEAELDRHSPVQVTELFGIVEVDAGYQFSLARRFDGRVYAWGMNSDGQLGDGSFFDKRRPIWAAGGLGTFVQLEAGTNHVLARTSNGRVYAWGSGSQGQRGDGTFVGRRNTPVAVGIAGVVDLSAGMLHSLAVRSDGTVWAWGWNHWLQLGNTNPNDSARPVRVNGLPLRAVQVAAAKESSIALTEDGTPWTWGRVQGEPIVITATPFEAGFNGALSIAVGESHYLAVVEREPIPPIE